MYFPRLKLALLACYTLQFQINLLSILQTHLFTVLQVKIAILQLYFLYIAPPSTELTILVYLSFDSFVHTWDIKLYICSYWSSQVLQCSNIPFTSQPKSKTMNLIKSWHPNFIWNCAPMLDAMYSYHPPPLSTCSMWTLLIFTPLFPLKSWIFFIKHREWI